MQKEKIIILGFGGNAVDFFETISFSFDIIAFVDDDNSKIGKKYNGVIVTDRSIIDDYPDAKIISLIGSEKTYKIREQIIGDFLIPDKRFAVAMHPSANVSTCAKIGFDVAIMAGVVIPSNAIIGNHVFVLANSVIHHDCIIGDYSLIGSNVTIAGHVVVGKSCFIGSASSIKNNIIIGDYSLAGMASNIVKSTMEYSRIAGNPGKKI